jgi:ubiquitin-protein ligase
MMTFIRNKKQFAIKTENRQRILKDIEELANLPNGVFAKVKQYEHGYYIKIIVDKTYIKDSTPENKYNTIPDIIMFLMVVDYSFPKEPPKIFCQTNFCFPNLMDGRNLSTSIIEKWNPSMRIDQIAVLIPNFIKNILNSQAYNFYGFYSIDAVYDLKNFNNMLVNTFAAKIDYNKELPKKPLFFNDIGDFILVLSDDCLVLFKQFETTKHLGKVVFWASLFALTDMQINKDKKVVRMNFYSDEKEQQQLRLKMTNVLFFRETLVKKMSNLKVTIEANKLIKGQSIERRLTMNDIKHMNINQLEYYINLFKKKIESDDINLYIINTFSILSGKAIEYYSKNDDGRQKEFLIQMQEVLKREDIQKLLKSSEINL